MKTIICSMATLALVLALSSCTPIGGGGGGGGGLADATVLTSDIAASTTWTTGTSYRVSTGNLHILNGVTLTIEAGVTIYVDTDSEITFDATSRLVTEGTSASPITFTSSATSPAKGDWDGVTVYSNNASFSNCIIEYAGCSSYDALYVGSGAVVTVANCTVAHNAFNGINADAATSTAISATISHTAIYDNTGIPLIANDGVSFETGNTFSSGSLVNTKQYIKFDSDIASLRSFGITTVPYDMSKGNTHVLSGGALTVSTGVTMQFETDCALSVDSAGALNASGATFTSSNAVPARGDWDGITVSGNASLSTCTVQYAGYSNYWAIMVWTSSATATITNCTLQHLKFGGIEVGDGATATISGCTIQTSYADNNGGTGDWSQAYGLAYDSTVTIGSPSYTWTQSST